MPLHSETIRDRPSIVLMRDLDNVCRWNKNVGVQGLHQMVFLINQVLAYKDRFD